MSMPIRSEANTSPSVNACTYPIPTSAAGAAVSAVVSAGAVVSWA